jgi:hypothetical protein
LTLKFAVGYQLDQGEKRPFSDIVRKYKEDIREIYFPWLDSQSGRSSLTNRRGAIDWYGHNKLISDLRLFRDLGFKLDLLLNGNCYGKYAISQYLQNNIYSILDYLEDVIGGVDIVTTASPAIAHMIKQRYPDMEVRASVNMRIGTVKGIQYVSHLFDSFYIQREYNRDFERIEELREWACKYDKHDESNSSYFRASSEISELGTMQWAMYSHGILMKARPESEIVAEYIKPYFNRHWDGIRGYYYTPPEKETGHLAVAGYKGVYHICFRIFDAYFRYALLAHKQLVHYCIKQLLPEPSFKTENVPSTARVTLTRKSNLTLLHFKVTHPEPRGEMDIVEEHHIFAENAIISVKGMYKSVYIVPSGEPVRSYYDGNYTQINLPKVTGYILIALEA